MIATDKKVFTTTDVPETRMKAAAPRTDPRAAMVGSSSVEGTYLSIQTPQLFRECHSLKNCAIKVCGAWWSSGLNIGLSTKSTWQ